MKLNRYLLTLLAFIFSTSAFATTLTLKGYVAHISSRITVEYSLDGYKTTHYTTTDSKGNFYDTVTTSSSGVKIDLRVMTCDSSYDSTTVSWTTRDTTTVLYPKLDYCRNSTTKCHADFSISINGRSITLINQSKGFNPTYQWDLGDGTTSTSKSLSHTYKWDSVYTICLKITDTVTNCSDSICRTYTIRGTSGCKAGFIANASGLKVNFVSTSNNAALYYWDFGDNTYAYTGASSHLYKKAGTYKVCHTIMDSSRTCADTVCKSIFVTSGCKAAFQGTTSFDSSGNSYLYLTNRSTASSAAKYAWLITGNGRTDTFYTYNVGYKLKPGFYNVCLELVDGSCSSMMCDSVWVDSLNSRSGCKALYTVSTSGLTATFTSTTNASSYGWMFGDGTNASTQNVTHTYKKAGTYTVCLVTSDSSKSCWDTLCKQVTVSSSSPRCNANFSVVKDSNNKYGVLIINRSTGSNLSYLWNFGDGSKSNSKFPNHTYKNFGTYNVCLTVSDSNRCTSTFCDTVGMDSTGKLLKAGFTITVVDGVTSVDDKDLNGKVRVFPNPAQDILTVESGDVMISNAVLLDMRGIPCKNADAVRKDEHVIQLDIRELPVGMYIMRVDTDRGFTTKLIQKM